MKKIVILLVAALFVLPLFVSCNKEDNSEDPEFVGNWFSEDGYYYYKVANTSKEGYYKDYFYKSLDDLKANKNVKMSE